MNEHLSHKSKVKHAFLISRSTFYKFFSMLVLVGGFSGLIYLFHVQDFYYKHFFDHGFVVSQYNILKMLLVPYIIWIIYATGYGFIALFVSPVLRKKYSLTDNIILGFGVGLGCWHVLMLLLGYLNLYYFSVMFSICFAVLVFSASHCKARLVEAYGAYKSLKNETTVTQIAVTYLLGMVLILLLLIRGLYPGGGGDYYTHYFYYYTTVLSNHGLMPNDVWYHYYYSKGAGLHFLGILLMDPEAPALMTYCCVVIAALALFNLMKKISQRSYWPEFCAILYVLYNLIVINGGDGGEFQKTHEETTAMVVLGVWAISMFEMRPINWVKSTFIMLTCIIVAAAFITQAITIYFAFFFGLQVILAYLTKRWLSLKFYFYLGVIATISVASAFLLNYIDTGLATDQALNVTWKFANVKRLYDWGVLPNIMLVAWIRDNYDMVAVPWSFLTVVKQLAKFMRADILWTLLIITSLGCVVYAVRTMNCPNCGKKKHGQKALADNISNYKSTIRSIGLITAVFVLLSIFAGHSQETSYLRFSSFFFPLVVLLCFSVLSFLTRNGKSVKYIFPVVVFFCVLFSWQHWGSDVQGRIKHVRRYMTGKYSLANAYSHQQSGMSFGGIHPGTYQAMQHIPAGSRVWSTNVSSYCMAPNCKVESVISFKLSPRLDEILNGTPEQAKKILQAEKLNYFIFSTDLSMIDILPYSHLFDPLNINRFFGIKWTDGKTYLLTWRGTGIAPLTRSFIRKYTHLVKTSNHPWFRFDKAKIAMRDTMHQLVNSPMKFTPVEFPWRVKKNSDGIIIRHASYGRGCAVYDLPGNRKRFSANNATGALKKLCQHKKSCNFMIDENLFGPEVPNCSMSLNVSYWCESKNSKFSRIIIKNATIGKNVSIKC